MKWFVLALSLLFASSAASARTPFQARCEDTIGKTVSVLSARDGGYRVDNTVSIRQLAQMKRITTPNSYVLGLTRTESRVAVGAGGKLLQDPASGYECVAPRIDVKLFYVPIVVYVGSEFSPGSCAYREILAHEMRHLKTYLDHLPKVEATVSAALARRFEGKPLYAPSGQASALLRGELNTGWMAFIKGEMEKVEPLQAAIDTPREYARLSEVCGGEVQSLIRLSKQRTKP
ncbi:MAG TPA: hypothetical protein VFT37_00340 [Telluria sp.]|nr:hypothetical protein [Telluria sp.]